MSLPPYKDSGPIDCSAPIDFNVLKGKTVIVTGGSSGLGLAYVKAFAEVGAIVTNADVRPPAEDISAPNIQFIQCDVRSWDDQVAVFKAAKEKSNNNGIDIVVANAGISGSDGFWEPAEDTDTPSAPDMKILEINMIGVMLMARLAVHYFDRQGTQNDKCLILKASIMGYLDTSGSPNYGTSKHAVRGLMCCLRRSRRCRANVIAPWFIQTGIMTEAVVKTLTEQLGAQGSGLATIEDSVHAVLRVAADTKINGRGFAILPRTVAEAGYVDLDLDDYKEGSLCYDLQNITGKLTHRKLPAAIQQVV